MPINTIIFGPTGGIASYALQYAASKGAHVTLAMRDPSKSINGLTQDQESSGKFTRVQADLSDSASVHSAASKANAESAFIYHVFGAEDAFRASIQALKDAGVKHVVFVSSIIVREPLGSNVPEEFIPFQHSQTEIALGKIFGDGNYTAVRPGYFASNLYRYAQDMKTGTVEEAYTTNPVDLIAPRDMGDISGHLLVQSIDQPLPKVTYLAGPQLIQLGDALKKVAQIASGKEIQVKDISEEESVRRNIQHGLPEPIAKYIARSQREVCEGTSDIYPGPNIEIAQKTIKELLGRDAITLEQWAEENKAAFA